MCVLLGHGFTQDQTQDPGSSVRHVTDCATRPGTSLKYEVIGLDFC